MRSMIHHHKPQLISAGCGTVCAALSLWLLHSKDTQGLYDPGHPAKLLLLIIGLVAAAALLLSVRGLKDDGRYSKRFPACPIAAAGTLISALGNFLCVPAGFTSARPMGTLCALTGIIAGIALAFLAWCRLQGRQPGFLIRSCVLAHLCVHLLCQYQTWIPLPQLTDYCFPLLASVCLVMACYHRTAFDAGLGKLRPYVFFSLMAVFFCCGAAVFSEDRVFYLTMLCWALTDQPQIYTQGE